jgi:hypothetical protein
MSHRHTFPPSYSAGDYPEAVHPGQLGWFSAGEAGGGAGPCRRDRRDKPRNSGVPESRGGLSVAQTLANRLRTAVGGWTGRTSYADINRGAGCAVRGSGQTHNPFSAETWKELWSRHKAGAAPEYRLFQPDSK